MAGIGAFTASADWLLTVDVPSDRVSVVAEPEPYRPRVNVKKRRRILKEHGARCRDPASGGPTRQPIMTAYRQRALACVAAMQAGPLRPRDLETCASDTGTILSRNVYGWFEKVERGVYRLAPTGVAAVAN